MKNLFNKRFEEEFLLSEKLRTTILASMFLFAILYTIINMLIFSNSVTKEELGNSLWHILIFHVALFSFESCSLLYINYNIKRRQHTISLPMQYCSSVIEICSPAIIIFLLEKQYGSPVLVLHSPIVYIYFIFIILSTLRLDFKLSLFTGLTAGSGFLIISFYLIHLSEPDKTNKLFSNEYITAVSKSLVLMLSGIGAAFVARQIRASINRSLAAAEAGNKIVNLFGQQISKEIVDEMLETEGSLQSKLMKVCVMFIDIRNFTKHVAGKSPGEIVAYQNAFFGIVIKAVTRHQGIINQFLGDGCMVTFGAPVALKNPSQHAVNAAIEICTELNVQIQKGDITPTSIGIGIHTGDAVTGNIGTMERQQYSITGSVVILAARIEQLNKDYYSQILVSEDVMCQIHTTRNTNSEFLGKIDLKGWHHPLGIYKIA